MIPFSKNQPLPKKKHLNWKRQGPPRNLGSLWFFRLFDLHFQRPLEPTAHYPKCTTSTSWLLSTFKRKCEDFCTESCICTSSISKWNSLVPGICFDVKQPTVEDFHQTGSLQVKWLKVMFGELNLQNVKHDNWQPSANAQMFPSRCHTGE